MNARKSTGATALVCAPLLVLAGPATAAPGPGGGQDTGPHVLAEGLVGPLGLAVAADGTAYVAEMLAGRLTAVSRRGRTSTVVDGPIAGVDARGRGTLTVTLSAPPQEGDEPLGDVASVSPRGELRAGARPVLARLSRPGSPLMSTAM